MWSTGHAVLPTSVTVDQNRGEGSVPGTDKDGNVGTVRNLPPGC